MPRLILCLALIFNLPAQTPSPEQGKVNPTGKFQPKGQAPSEVSDTGKANEKILDARFKITELDAKRIQIGEIIIHRTERTIAFPVSLGVTSPTEFLEYLLVHEKGKTHESLLTTKVQPRNLHLAALLLGVNGQSPAIDLTWRKNGPDARRPLTDLIVPVEGTPQLPADQWRYSGSTFDSRGFIAQREGSFITILNDPAALIRHPQAAKLGRDDQFRVFPKNLPTKGTPVRLVLTFPKKKP